MTDTKIVLTDDSADDTLILGRVVDALTYLKKAMQDGALQIIAGLRRYIVEVNLAEISFENYQAVITFIHHYDVNLDDALIKAIEENNELIAEFILDYMYTVNLKTLDVCLAAAIKKNNQSIIAQLIVRGADVQMLMNYCNDTLVHNVKYLLPYAMELKKLKFKVRKRPVMLANFKIAQNDLPRLPLTEGRIYNMYEGTLNPKWVWEELNKTYTPAKIMEKAIHNNYIEIVKYGINAGVDFDIGKGIELALLNNNLIVIKLLVKQYPKALEMHKTSICESIAAMGLASAVEVLCTDFKFKFDPDYYGNMLYGAQERSNYILWNTLKKHGVEEHPLRIVGQNQETVIHAVDFEKDDFMG